MENEHKELNLLDFIYLIFRGIWRLLKQLGHSLLFLFRFSIQNIWVILIVMILAFFAGWFFTRPAHTTFKGGATILFVEEARPAVFDHIVRLNSHCRTKDLATDLNLPDSIANKIRKFEVFNFIDLKNDQIPDFADFDQSPDFLVDTVNVVMNDRLYLRISAKGLTDFKPVQKSLQTYFDNQAGVSLLTKRGISRLQTNMDVYTQEIKRVDSLANYEYFSKSKPTTVESGRTFVVVEKDKELFYKSIFALIDTRDHMATQLAQNQHNINFQSDLVLSGPLLILSLALWVFGGYVLGALIAWGIVRRKEIVVFLKK